MKQTNNQTSGLTITHRTECFIQALKKLSEAENEVLNAMSVTYGEEQGAKMKQNLPFNDIRDEVLKCLGVVIVENQTENHRFV